MQNRTKYIALLNALLITGIVLLVNIVGSYFHGGIDLTEDKRFTLTSASKKLVRDVDDVVYIRVLLGGEFPAGFKRLQNALTEKLEEFRNLNGYIEYEFEDPSEGTPEQINQRMESFAKEGIVPTSLTIYDSGERSEKIIYPFAIFHHGQRKIPVNLLENQLPGQADEEVLNNSVSLLEYKLASALSRVLRKNKPIIMFTAGQGELAPIETADLEKDLQKFYNTGRINLDSTNQIHPKIDVLVVARPRTKFSMKNKFKMDQYIMNGGRVLWMIDQLNVSLDSLRGKAAYIPYDYDTGLNDLFFKYGFRVEPNMVLDLECSKIPLASGMVGNAPQMELFPWYYHGAVAPNTTHPVSRNLDRVHVEFPSSIELIKTKTNIRKSVILESSKYSRLQFPPARVNFDILQFEPDPAKFNKPNQLLGVVLEGQFPSLYKNRVPLDMQKSLNDINQPFISESVPTKMIVFSDGDLGRNYIDRDGKFRMLGFNPFDKVLYANKELIMNAIAYLSDSSGLMDARAKEVKLRLLDKVRTKEEKTKWQLINLGVPLLFTVLLGFVFNYLRRRKYAFPQKSTT